VRGGQIGIRIGETRNASASTIAPLWSRSALTVPPIERPSNEPHNPTNATPHAQPAPPRSHPSRFPPRQAPALAHYGLRPVRGQRWRKLLSKTSLLPPSGPNVPLQQEEQVGAPLWPAGAPMPAANPACFLPCVATIRSVAEPAPLTPPPQHPRHPFLQASEPRRAAAASAALPGVPPLIRTPGDRETQPRRCTILASRATTSQPRSARCASARLRRGMATATAHLHQR
jgi:hypothetical protein